MTNETTETRPLSDADLERVAAGKTLPIALAAVGAGASLGTFAVTARTLPRRAGYIPALGRPTT